MSTERVLIAGASSGVGAAVAERFAREHADVVMIARSRDGLERVAERVRALGGRPHVHAGDLTDAEFVTDAVDSAAAELGGLDVLVDAVAITIFGPFSEVDPDDFDRVVDVTFGGQVNTVRSALPHLEATGGVIVNVGSLNAGVPLPAWSSYSAAKHAQRGFLNTLAVELRSAGSQVRIAQLHPGQINTPVWDQTASATGRLPRRPPEAYDPRSVAEAIRRLARDPHPEQIFGAETLALNALWNVARPAADLVLRAIFLYFTSGQRVASAARDALREPVGAGHVSGHMIARPSLSTWALRQLPFGPR